MNSQLLFEELLLLYNSGLFMIKLMEMKINQTCHSYESYWLLRCVYVCTLVIQIGSMIKLKTKLRLAVIMQDSPKWKWRKNDCYRFVRYERIRI